MTTGQVCRFICRISSITLLFSMHVFSVKLIKIVVVTVLFGFSLFRHFLDSLLNFLNNFIWLMIFDEGSIPEMHIRGLSGTFADTVHTRANPSNNMNLVLFVYLKLDLYDKNNLQIHQR